MLKYKAKFSGSTQRKNTTEMRFSVSNDIIDNIDLISIDKHKGWLFFSTNELTKEVEDVMNDRTVGVTYKGKTESQRLRGVLYQLYDQSDGTHEGGTESFAEFYSRIMNETIKYYWEQIEK